MTDQTIRSWSLIKGHTSVCNCNHYKSTAIYEYRLVGCKKSDGSYNIRNNSNFLELFLQKIRDSVEA